MPDIFCNTSPLQYRARLTQAKGVGSDCPLGWAPDFPAEEACQAVAELIGACSAKDCGAVRDQPAEELDELVPGWDEMIGRAADRALNDR